MGSGAGKALGNFQTYVPDVIFSRFHSRSFKESSMLKKTLMIAALGVATTSAFAVDVEQIEKSIPLKDG